LKNTVKASRSFEAHWDQYGNLSFRGHLSPDQGAVFLKALDKALVGMGLSFEQKLDRKRSFEQELYDPYPVAAQREIKSWSTSSKDAIL